MLLMEPGLGPRTRERGGPGPVGDMATGSSEMLTPAIQGSMVRPSSQARPINRQASTTGGRMTVVALLLVAAAAPVATFAPGMALRSTVHPAQCGETRARDPVEDSEVVVTPDINIRGSDGRCTWNQNSEPWGCNLHLVDLTSLRHREQDRDQACRSSPCLQSPRRYMHSRS